MGDRLRTLPSISRHVSVTEIVNASHFKCR